MKGYVVTNESDTIYGELGYRDGTGDWKECFYRQQGEVEYKSLFSGTDYCLWL